MADNDTKRPEDPRDALIVELMSDEVSGSVLDYEIEEIDGGIRYSVLGSGDVDDRGYVIWSWTPKDGFQEEDICPLDDVRSIGGYELRRGPNGEYIWLKEGEVYGWDESPTLDPRDDVYRQVSR